MMRLPARLIVKLARIRSAQIFNSASTHSLVQFVDPKEVLHPGADAPVSHDQMLELIKSPAPVVWIGGSEPLLHAGIGHFVRAIAQSGHFVFLETDGTLLRRRIHEFQPLPQVFLTVLLDSLESARSALSVEGLGAARLSGFFTVVHSRVREDSDVAQLKALRTMIGEMDLDGWLISAASTDGDVARKASEARCLIPSSFWRKLSEHIEEALLAQTPAGEMQDAQALLTGRVHTEAGEENVRIA